MTEPHLRRAQVHAEAFLNFAARDAKSDVPCSLAESSFDRAIERFSAEYIPADSNLVRGLGADFHGGAVLQG